MPRITIPIGSKIDQTEGKKIEIKVKNTNYWVYGEQKKNYLWDAYLVDPIVGYREKLKEDVTTKSFALFSNSILKTPFPYSGKKTANAQAVSKFIKNIITIIICKTTTQSQPQSQDSQ